jgi:hypothetical protein
LRFNNSERPSNFDSYQSHQTLDHPTAIKPYSNYLSQEAIRSLQAAIKGEETQESPSKGDITTKLEHVLVLPEGEVSEGANEDGAVTPKFN